jgi:glycosyltransferase involved in cell wall biosynthesis
VRRETAQAEVRARFGIQAPFLLSVGDLQPRKNHAGLIAALTRLIASHPNLPHHLALAGKDTWFAGRVRAAAKHSGIADRVHFLGFVSDEDLLHLYNACEVFCFPSFYEGFGLPIVEAMASGAAVCCSNTSAIPEVADGAALLFDPYRTDEIARAVLDLIQLPELAARMRRLGSQRAKHFSWQNTARETLEVYYEVVEQRQVAGRAVLTAPLAPR